MRRPRPIIGPIIPIFTGQRARLLTFEAPDPLTVGMADILAYIADRDPTPIGHWRELSAEEYSRSFAVAQTAGYGVVADIYEGLLESVRRGETAKEFAARVMPTLRAKGWISAPGKAAPRLELIYDTNLRVARGAGRWQRYSRQAAAFPYLRGVTARDERVRHPPRSDSDHRAFDGIILPVRHPFWLRWWTPLGFRCRCTIIQMTRSQLARWPTGVTSEAELAVLEQRLGEPIFASPASFDAQLAKVASIANEERLPGQPGMNLRNVRAKGNELLNKQLIEEGINELADVLNSIFGQAA